MSNPYTNLRSNSAWDETIAEERTPEQEQRTLRRAREAAAKRGERSPIVDMLASVRVFRTGFQAINVPVNAIAPIANTIGSFKLASFKVPDMTGGDVLLYGYIADMLACCTDATAAIDGFLGYDAGTPDTLIAWGTRRGTGAAIVIGTNLPGDVRSWTQLPAGYQPLWGMNTSGGTNTVLSTDTEPQWPFVLRFPPGDLNDDVPGYARTSYNSLPGGLWVKAGQTLDVCLLVDAPLIGGQAVAHTMLGRADVTLFCIDPNRTNTNS